MSVDCELIDYHCDEIEKNENGFRLQKNFIRSFIDLFLILYPTRKKTRECKDFEKKYLSSKSYNKKNIFEANDYYDGFISGSDQIWNLTISGNDYSYFLDFALDSKNKIAYGSSVGRKFLEGEEDYIVSLLSRYKFLSTREKDTCDYINNKLNIPCSYVPDPTMLLEKNEWETYAGKSYNSEYVLVYYPYKQILQAAKTYAKRNRKKLIVMPLPFYSGIISGKKVYSPVEFLGLIKNADAIFTDSYHGFLFSLYFEKPVWTNNKSNRMESIISELSLKNCLISNDYSFSNIIDYDVVNSLIQKKRNLGKNFLSIALSSL